MDFLKEILGEELFAKFAEKVNAFNGNEANKDKQIKIANLGTGEYIGKGKYDALQALLDGKTNELETANNLIADLKKSNKNDGELQTKITTYEGQVQELQTQLEQTKLDNAIQIALLEAKVTDVDYMTFKLKEKGEVKLDENGKIKGWEETLKSLQTQFPNQFESSSTKKIEEHKLDNPQENNGGMTKAEFLKKPYGERAKFAQDNPEAFEALMNE
ncbi:phage scaffolding protein [Holdemania sp. 1001095H_141210_F2]|uniref:phage scaffolding protein n=1 Tax=Holdemania sp. 1001095H_141210_F2 TaxID=2787149 RepID=UPI00189CB433|nr:phage scaffolding protein [Holdemania sp. 1001095H_141210_F2]